MSTRGIRVEQYTFPDDRTYTNREEILMTERVRQLKTTEIMQIIGTDEELFTAYCEGGEFREFMDSVNDATNGEEAVRAMARGVLHGMRAGK